MQSAGPTPRQTSPRGGGVSPRGGMSPRERAAAHADGCAGTNDVRALTAQKYSDVSDDLQMAKMSGDARYGDQPREALERVLEHDAGFHTDVQSELRRIEEGLTRVRLEAMWADQNPDSQDDPDWEQRREEWVNERFDDGRKTVTCRLPKRKGPNPAYSHITGQIEATQASRNELFASRVAKRKGPAAVMGHPAERVTDGNVYRSSRKPYSGPNEKYRQEGEGHSQVKFLFSKTAEGQPDFLTPGSKRDVVETRRNRERALGPGRNAAWNKGAMGPKRDASGTVPRLSLKARMRSRSAPVPARGGGYVTPRFMDVHDKKTTQTAQVSKQQGEAPGLVVDPETLRILDLSAPLVAKHQGTAKQQLLLLKGMRLTHVWFAGGVPESSDAVHTSSDVRRALGKATHASVVYLRADPWTKKWAVEKKKSEYADKVIGRRKAGGSVAGSRRASPRRP